MNRILIHHLTSAVMTHAAICITFQCHIHPADNFISLGGGARGTEEGASAQVPVGSMTFVHPLQPAHPESRA